MAQSLSLLFFEATGKKAGEQTALTASGSNRRYYRIESEDKTTSLIGVQGTSRDENHAFLYMAEHFMQKGLNVPKVMAVSDDEMNYVQQDLGNASTVPPNLQSFTTRVPFVTLTIPPHTGVFPSAARLFTSPKYEHPSMLD